MESLRRQLKKLGAIQPRKEYAQWSKAEIFGAATSRVYFLKTPLFSHIQFGMAAALMGAFLVMVVSGALLWSPLSREAAYIDFQRLVAEAEELNIEIKMAELYYYTTTKKAVSDALQEAAETIPGQLSMALLQQEQDPSMYDEEAAKEYSEAIMMGLDTLIE